MHFIPLWWRVESDGARVSTIQVINSRHPINQAARRMTSKGGHRSANTSLSKRVEWLAMGEPFVELLRLADTDAPHEVEDALRECVARATAAWPGVVLDDAEFVHAIARRLQSDDLIREIVEMHTNDLYLACGCAIGDVRALSGFESSCGAVIGRAIAASGASPAERADLGQVIRQRLLVAPADGRVPRIATYSARGSLRAWVRVVATREVARVLPRARREIAVEDDRFASLVSGDDDPQVAYLKRHYREEFKCAFHAAVEALDGRLRLVLQQHALDGLGVDQLASLHRVHRATAARWVQAAHESVLAGTRRALSRRLRLSRAEFASVMRLIQSQLDVSLSLALRRSP
jgi:RNA polymerase sigma-70 factor, ECF subfamily